MLLSPKNKEFVVDDQTAVELAERPLDVGPPKHLLFVDDDPTQTEVLAYRFRKLGYRVTEAQNAPAAWEAIGDQRPHLVLLDVEMPGMDGLMFCQQLKDDPETCDVPVILLSGSDRDDIVRQARSAGSQFFLAKPYDPNTLLAIVQTSLEESPGW